KEVSTHDTNWRLFFAHNQISPLVVSYERLSGDVAHFLRSMVECFGLELPPSDFAYDEEKPTAARASLIPPSSKIKGRFLLAHQQVFQAPQVAIKRVSEAGGQTGEYQKSETPIRSVATNLAAHRERSGRYAIITPYYKEPRDVLERCIKSVRDQTVATDHFLV